MDKSVEFVTQFIEIYRKHCALWKIKDESYSDRQLKQRGYNELLQLYKTVDEKSTIDTVKKKINNLKTTFKKELKKVERSKKSGASTEEIYNPSLWYYNLLLFTADQEKGRKCIDNDEGSEKENYEFEEDIIEAIEDESLNLSFCLGQSISETPRLQSRASTISSQDVTANKSGNINKKQKDVLLDKACSVLNSKDDECDVIGSNIAHKLRRMDEYQRMLSEHFINNILFFGLQKQLNVNSVFRLNDSNEQNSTEEES